LGELFGTRPARKWIGLCESIGVPAAPINTIAEMFADPQVQARRLRQTAVHPASGEVPLVASPLGIPTAPATTRLAPPHLGEHTQEILTGRLGCTADELAAWRAAGVV
jgi:crotonobetainyl-CoA:carnitine CoA-transferase CaiB-like acyl-CoA transferase